MRRVRSVSKPLQLAFVQLRPMAVYVLNVLFICIISTLGSSQKNRRCKLKMKRRALLRLLTILLVTLCSNGHQSDDVAPVTRISSNESIAAKWTSDLEAGERGERDRQRAVDENVLVSTKSKYHTARPDDHVSGNEHCNVNSSSNEGTCTSDSHSKSKDNEMYEKAKQYWTSRPATASAMIGGYDHLHQADIHASQIFLQDLRDRNLVTQTKRAIDCGCGVGRVTKAVLLPIFDKVDMVDLNETFVKASADYIGADGMDKVDQQFTSPLQLFHFPANTQYDVIWIQWVTGHLADTDLVNFLKRARSALAPHGCIIIKDNIFDGANKMYAPDHSWMRTLSELHETFDVAGLRSLEEQTQPEFEDMYEVRMFALKPIESGDLANTDNVSAPTGNTSAPAATADNTAQDQHQHHEQPDSKEDEHAWDLLIEAEEGFAAVMYKEAKQKWEAIPATRDGILFGRGDLSQADIADSRDFIKHLRQKMNLKEEGRALDCGSGIGRVAKHLLLEEFDVVDLVDIIPEFLSAAAEYIGEPEIQRIGHRFRESLVTFTPQHESYDLIWLQLVTGQLTDADLIKFLKRGKAGLRKGGMIIIKDTLSTNSERQIRNDVLAWVRTEDELLNIFHRAGLGIVHDRLSTVRIDSNEMIIIGLKQKGASPVEPPPQSPPKRSWLESAAAEEVVTKAEQDRVESLLISAENGLVDDLYAAAKAKWSATPASAEKVLGRWAHLNKADIANSGDFIAELRAAKILTTQRHKGRALDCGSGVARVTRNLLLEEFEAVDLVDYAKHFMKRTEAYSNLGGSDSQLGEIKNRFTESLVTFTPQAEAYDLIWLQWISGQLTDEQLIEFLNYARAGLHKDGVIVIKDNVAVSRRERAVDVENMSWIRTETDFRNFFHVAGLELAIERDTDLHDSQSDVVIFALRAPKAKYDVSKNEDDFSPAEGEPVKEKINTATEELLSEEEQASTKHSDPAKADLPLKENESSDNENTKVHFENDVKDPNEQKSNNKSEDEIKAEADRAWDLLENGESGYTEELYAESKATWNTIPATVDGMTGGDEKLHASDILDSWELIDELKHTQILTTELRALDCGSGIGRVTKAVLLKEFDTVDLVDFNRDYLDAAADYIGGRGMRRVDKLLNESLTTFAPQPKHYDLIWIQWVTGQLVDVDLIEFLKRARDGLTPSGVIVVKENVSVSMDRNVNGGHVAWIRSENELLDEFDAAGLDVVTGRDCGIFDDVADILAYVLKPKRDNNANTTSEKKYEDKIINEKISTETLNHSKNVHVEL